MTSQKKSISLPCITLFSLIFYPLLLVYMMLLAWIKSLYKARILLGGRWESYMGFYPSNAINSLFYRTQWININRYGRLGTSPLLGLGNYPLKKWFHLSLPASYIYSKAGAVTTLVATLIWSISHLVWIDSGQPWWWVVIISCLLLFSSTSYAMAFARQNYQILGWMFFPFALYLTSLGSYILATFAWCAVGLSGITSLYFAVIIVFALSFIYSDFYILLTLIPALLIMAMRFKPLIAGGGFNQSLSSMAKLIGLSKSNIRYDREMKHFSLSSVYFLALYFFSTLLFSYSINSIAILPLMGCILYALNQRFFRVADEESVIVVFLTLFSFSVINSPPSFLSLISFWLAASPSGLFLSIQSLSPSGKLSPIIVHEPFDHSPIENDLCKFFSSLSQGDRVVFAFDDPQGKYSNLFDGYRCIHEFPLYIASLRGIHLMPDWYAVADTNYPSAPQCWGRSPNAVYANCERWNASYAIIYQETETLLSEEWSKSFTCISKLDWKDYMPHAKSFSLWNKSNFTPKWFLLKSVT